MFLICYKTCSQAPRSCTTIWMDISSVLIIEADVDTSCDKSDALSIALDILDPATGQSNISSAAANCQELPPPHHFRRQACSGKKNGFSSDIKLKTQNLNYLASYRAATGRLLQETELKKHSNIFGTHTSRLHFVPWNKKIQTHYLLQRSVLESILNMRVFAPLKGDFPERQWL